jgi:hypothetical protein
MRVALVELKPDAANLSPMLQQENRREELRANSITVEWTPHHVVFNLVTSGQQQIAFRAEDVIRVDLHNVEE